MIGDAAFVHDTLFMPDSGTARCDFPGGNARKMWRSIQDILSLPEETRIFTGHDYQPAYRERGQLPAATEEMKHMIQKHLRPDWLWCWRTIRRQSLNMRQIPEPVSLASFQWDCRTLDRSRNFATES